MENDKTNYFRSAIDLLLLRNGLRTSIGIVLGSVLGAIGRVASPKLSVTGVDLSAVKSYEFIAAGVLTMHLPTAAVMLFRSGEIDEPIEKAFAVIRRAVEKGLLYPWQARELYFQVAMRVLTQIELKEADREMLEQLRMPPG